MGGECSTHGKLRNAHTILIGKNERKRPLGRPRNRHQDIIIDLKEIGCEGMNWTQFRKGLICLVL
jgi:hypothetical protein